MEPFLNKIAKVYYYNESERFSDYCFVFPNKRSGVFFEKYLKVLAKGTFIIPTITTISDFIDEISGSVEASRYEQLFILYDVYKSLTDDGVDFDRFQFWGDMILNDFNDVDKYLVDARQLFVNLKRYKEIKSNYLTNEQIEVIKKYWGDDMVGGYADRFWNHIDDSAQENFPRDKFLKLWEVMYEIYTQFNNQILRKGLSYSGRSYRRAAEIILKSERESLQFKRYIFVGFSMLSTAEIKIFEKLRDLDCADFYWDFNSPMFTSRYNKASRFLPNYIKSFPSRFKIEIEENTSFPAINIKGVPSNIGQVKEVGAILQKLSSEKIINPENAINTAVVLPDENLFIPLIHSLPEEIKTVNITMGYPMRYTQVSALMKSVVSMQLRSRLVKKEYVYFYEDVQDVIAQSLLKTIAVNECNNIQNYIVQNKAFNIKAEYLIENYPLLKPLFSPVKDIQNVDGVFTYVRNLVDFLIDKLSQVKKQSLDIAFMSHYKRALESLHSLAHNYDVKMSEHTIFHLIERAISSDTVNFVGEPLNGLQIMGVLETRALDFENIIILSMNERIFPRKHYSRSFIPETLRRGYGMSTIEFQESIYAYYFYRLLARSKNAYLLYDARTSGTKSGDVSRFIHQLKFFAPKSTTKFSIVDYEIQANINREIVVEKTDEIMQRLELFRTDDKHKKYLSASAIKSYVKCPLRFFLEKIEGLNIDNEINDYIDDITFGNIIHGVVENIYKELCDNDITVDVLDEWKNNRQKQLDEHLTRMINKHYNCSRSDNDLTEIVGEAAVLKDIMLYMILQLFENEKQFTPIKFIDAEKEMIVRYKVSDDLQVNFRQIIDRIDYATVNGIPILRIIDYKTGSDELKSSFDKIFDNSYSTNDGAILQLFIYCLLYSIENNTDEAIQPIVYKMRTLSTKSIPPLNVNGLDVWDYRLLKDEFCGYFNAVLTELFDKNVPFIQTKNVKNCHNCNFKNICDKESKSF